MKNLLLMLPLSLVLVACADTSQTPATSTPKPIEKAVEEIVKNEDVPCHQMPDGSWMGDCEKPHNDEGLDAHDHEQCSDETCPMPELKEEHPHADGEIDEHSEESQKSEEDHPHAEGETDDHSNTQEDHDDSNEPPHRH